MISRLIRALPSFGSGRTSRGLAVLAYHRIGPRSGTMFDPWVITEADQLDEHIRYAKKHHRVVGLEEALAIATGREPSQGTSVFLTFDDGYIDNYETAFPILQAHGVPAAFFLVSSFTGGGVIPWWDQIAWLVKATQVNRLCLAHGSVCLYPKLADRDDVVMKVLDFYKSSHHGSPDAFIGELEQACELKRPTAGAARMFLSWSEAREMKAAGMSICSHTHTHPILARLSPEEQARDLAQSKQILERELGGPVNVLAYPVGGPDDFTDATAEAAERCGYRAAFSCHGGFNGHGTTRMFDVKRIPVYGDARPTWLLGRAS